METITAFRILNYLTEHKSAPHSTLAAALDISQHELLRATEWLSSEDLVADRGDHLTISPHGELAGRIMNPKNLAPPTDDPMQAWIAQQTFALRVDFAQVAVKLDEVRADQQRLDEQVEHHNVVLFGNGKEGERIGVVAKLRLMTYVQAGTLAAVILLTVLVVVLFIVAGGAV
jgi:hypothetical protein